MSRSTKARTTIKDFSSRKDQVASLDLDAMVSLPQPLDSPDCQPPLRQPSEEQRAKFETSLDGFAALAKQAPADADAEKRFVDSFISGLRKLLSADSNWTFLQPLVLSLENCTRCQTCADSCPIYVGSGREEIYRPTYRAELLRRLVKRYLSPGGRFFNAFAGSDVEANVQTISRLAELSYRCTLCRRCAQSCPIGVDNGLITRELRKLFSQEMGIAPKELHSAGSIKHLGTGSSTGMIPAALLDTIEFLEDEVEERTGMRFKWPVDKEGADILLIHNAGEYMAWPESVEAFAIVLEKAGISYTLSSDLMGYDAVNYGTWYDDVQFSRIALRQMEVAKKLGVKKIVIGECGHAHKALTVVADRILTDEHPVPRESFLTLMEDIVMSGRLNLDPRRNDFPVTLHDPCNMVRLMGIVEPQRRILRRLCPQFREMSPAGVENYCCGAGSGLALVQGANFPDWRIAVAGRMKMKQIVEAFSGVDEVTAPKYVCAPCSNCKSQMRDLFECYDATEKTCLHFGGLVELIVNAMTDLPRPFIGWEEA